MTTLKAVLQEACLMELEDIPSEEELSTDETLTFSPAFEKKMKKLIRRANHPMRYRVGQAAACLLLALLLGGTVLAISPEARAAFVGWVREVYVAWFVYRFEGESNNVISEPQYRPTWLPEGYSQSLVPELEGQVNVLYTSDAGPTILFAYVNSASSLNVFAVGDMESFKVTVNNTPADFYLDNDTTTANCLVWESPENDLIYWIAANLSMDDMIKIAESVQEIPTPQMVYQPTWIPDGFTESRHSESRDLTYYFYEDENWNSISFAYSQNTESSSLYIERNDVDVQTVQIGDLYADLYLDQNPGNANGLVWTNMGILFWIHGNCSGDEIIKIAESVTAQEVPEQEVF